MVSTGQIIPTALHSEMQKSYLEYAMSVIVGRALPDVRDGLKPVHRRILYAMHELGLTPDRPYRKCARVVGDVLGKYHPHGDQAVYDALVRMVQDFSTRYPLLAGHGNFGSIDNDPPAAMRYTETRLASISHEAMLSEIGDATVEFIGNFDNSQQEPVVLPAQLPILLLNGCTGIAVGMATNIPPHNLGEIIDGLIALIDRPTLPDDKLFELIPGPDFPTGGEIIGTEGIRDAYTTGKGSITMRGVARIEEIPGSKGRHRRTAIVVTELPFQVNKAAWIEKVAQLVNQGNLEGVADLRDESDREGIRVVVELKREANPQSVLAHLYQQTALQSNFGVILLALVNSQPRQLSLRQVLEQFLAFREETLNRRYTYELDKAQKRIHIVSGLMEALTNLDALIELLRCATDGSSAKIQLQSRYNMSEAQADAILAMPLRRLTNLERQNLQAEYQELSEKIAELQKLLNDRAELLKALKKELRALKRKYADVRRTRIHKSVTSEKSSRTTTETNKNSKINTTSKDGNKDGNKDTNSNAKLPLVEPEAKPENGKSKSKIKQEKETSTTAKSTTKTTTAKTKSKTSLGEIEANQTDSAIQSIATQLSLLEEEETRLEFTQKGYGRRQTINNDKNKDRRSGKKTKTPNGSFEDDIIIESQIVKAEQNVLLVTKAGKAYAIKVRDIPITPPQKRGTPLISLLPNSAQSEGQNVIAQFILSDNLETSQIVMLTKQGRIKRLPFIELENLSSRGVTVFRLKDDDELLYANITNSSQNLILATSGGRLLRMEVNQQQLPLMNRSAMGNLAMALGKKEQIIAQIIVNAKENILLVSEQGYVKKMPVSVLRLSNRGDLGTQALQFTNKTDNLAAVIPAKSQTKIVFLTNEQKLIHCDVDSLELHGKDSKGDRLSQLKEGEQIISVVVSLENDRE